MEHQDQQQEDILQEEVEVELNHQQVMGLLKLEEQVEEEMVLFILIQQPLLVQLILEVEEVEVYHHLHNQMDQEDQDLLQ